MGFEASFIVRGNPRPQPRVKARIHGKHATVYDPGTADDWKGDVIRAGAPLRPKEPLEGPVSIRILFFLKRPKRLYRKKDPDVAPIASSGPDLDNLVKATLDALQADGWFRNDSQVAQIRAQKRYHTKTGHPGADVSVETPKA